jgi:multimeric flavodoxin WrbA
MKVLGIYGSPRKGGNTDRLLDEALKGARDAGAEVSSVRCCDLKMSGCIECGSCDKTGQCAVPDDMQNVYPQLLGADAIILASPIFFYGITSQAKALMDRCQALWCKRMLEKNRDRRQTYDGGRGYLICVGATRGKQLFDGAQLVAKYFYDALDMGYEGGVFVKKVEAKGDIQQNAEALNQAYELGKTAADPQLKSQIEGVIEDA